MPGKKLPDKVVEQLVRKGMGNTEVARWLEVHENLDVTPSAVGMWRIRHGYARERIAPSGPWSYRLRRADKQKSEAVATRAYFRREAGLALNKQAGATLLSWERRLYGAGEVLDYDEADGFRRVAARPGIDLGIIREPDGRPHPPREPWRERFSPA